MYTYTRSGSMLLIGAFGKKISSAQKRWVESVERRVGVTTQILTSMKSIKMAGLARYSAALTQSFRETELVISLSMRRFLTVGVGLCMSLCYHFVLGVDLTVSNYTSVCNTCLGSCSGVCSVHRSSLAPWRDTSGFKGVPGACDIQPPEHPTRYSNPDITRSYWNVRLL